MKKLLTLALFALCFNHFTLSQSNRVSFDLERQFVKFHTRTSSYDAEFTSTSREVTQYGIGYERIIKNRIKVKSGISRRALFNSIVKTDVRIDTMTGLNYLQSINYNSTNVPLLLSIILQDNDYFQVSFFGGATYRRFKSFNDDRNSQIGQFNYSFHRFNGMINRPQNLYQIDFDYGVNFDFYLDKKKKFIVAMGLAFSQRYRSRFIHHFSIYERNFDGSNGEFVFGTERRPIKSTPLSHIAFQISYAYAFGK